MVIAGMPPSGAPAIAIMVPPLPAVLLLPAVLPPVFRLPAVLLLPPVSGAPASPAFPPVSGPGLLLLSSDPQAQTLAPNAQEIARSFNVALMIPCVETRRGNL
jgi:hypothetical protein